MKQILVIEDMTIIRSDLAEALILEGFDVIQAEDGLEGIQIAQDHLPDLILCDVMLPLKDGFEVIHELSRHSETMCIPIILISAGTEKDWIKRGMELGAKAYFTKPFSLAELLAAIEEVLLD